MARARKPAPAGRKAKVAPPEPKPRACRECKKQKIFCSKHTPKCERCQAKNLDCDYAGPKKIRVNEDKLRYLKAKLQRYEDIFRNLPPAVLSTLPDHLSPLTSMPDDQDDDKDDDDEDDVVVGEGPSQTQGGPEGEGDGDADDALTDQFKQMSIYLRASRGSADHFFQVATKMSGLRSVEGEGEGDSASHGGDDTGAPVFYDPGMLPSRTPAKELTQRIIDLLPPVDIARRYFHAQHMYIGTIFAFSDPETFDRQLRAAYDGPPTGTLAGDTEACLTYAKILGILALGRLYSVNRTNNSNDGNAQPDGTGMDETDSPPGFGYFAHALALLPDVHEPGSILGVETLAYIGYFFQNINRRDAAYLYIGLALRMAVNLGLHQELSTSLRLSQADREHRRRVFWSIYSLDRILSLKSGHPVAILDEDIGVNMPSRLPGEPADSPVMVLRCYTELSRILGDITALIYRRTSTTTSTSFPTPSSKGSLIATVHTILQSLNQWEEALPRHLRLDPDRGTKLSRESISMYLHYYQCINMTARPLLFHVVQRRIAAIRAAGADAATEKERAWEIGLSSKTVAVIHACMSAARNTVQIMSKAAEHNMVATYGYMDGEHAFSAAIVLALVYTAFPTQASTVEAMAKGLALLRRMGDLGNVYVAARYEQLARLRSILGPGVRDGRDGKGKGREEPLQRAPQQPQYQQPAQAAQDAARPPSPLILPEVSLQEAAHPHEQQLYIIDQQPLPENLPGPAPGYADHHLLQRQGPVQQVGLPGPPPLFNNNYQPHLEGGSFGLDLNLNDADFFNNLDLSAIDASGVLFDPAHAAILATGDGQDGQSSDDAADTTLWTSAFNNPTGFDISQLMPEADMSDYFTF
ncbi:Transcriptional activator [Sporothrix bragantina]|uniref:Transcriptional activator n=1 Tax=Sporothrix bragantina TaxID=671064 RepID=A0ABP0ASC9_9PEZI